MKNRHFVERLQYIALAVVFVAAVISIVALLAFTKENRNRIKADCELLNQFKSTELELWNYILSIPTTTEPPPEKAADQDKKIADFKAYINKAFMPKDCD